ncbi:hypothetical protein EN45_091150 [Penicillium chrysogenum]|uniref:Pc12g07140 protein n=2 Tax=Penicillium chrysogenum species complex TaxID=254878 RepID=B6H0Z0_PENRW|nr:hypothetical protein N7534_008978 [Penicillium rubens]KZN84951.1 hypothetical protein EN45_091150 [Penicillium chrysogenum]CAP80341.1 Pc12g07140 [Penicillium rubens Wisconsin 54-1255]
MSPTKYAAAALFAASALATPNPQASTPSAASTEPSEFTANPNVGAGGNTFTDSPRFRLYGATGTEADKTLQMLESAYTCFVTDLGWRSSGLSYNSDSDTADIWYKENIYSVNSLDSAAGVMGSDPKTGLSFVQVVNTYLTDPSVTVHEYGHALTYHAQNWVDQTATGAWWEPLANWFADTWMTSDLCASAREKYSQQAGGSMIELKKVIGDSHQVIVDGSVDSGNYYQSWPILSYLTNNPDNFTGLGQDAVLRLNLEYEVGSNETPLHTLQRLLGNRATVQQVVGRYWAHMAYVDIGSQAANRAFLEQRETLGYENLDGSGQSYTVKAARQPQYFGANINPIQVSGEGSVTVTVKSDSAFTATLAVRNKDSGVVRYVDLENGSGEVTVGGSEEASLVVVNTPAELIQYDPFKLSSEATSGLDYAVQITGGSF